MYVCIYNCVLVPVLSKFIFTSFCSILTIFGLAGWYPFSTYSKNFRTFDPFPQKNKYKK